MSERFITEEQEKLKRGLELTSKCLYTQYINIIEKHPEIQFESHHPPSITLIVTDPSKKYLLTKILGKYQLEFSIKTNENNGCCITIANLLKISDLNLEKLCKRIVNSYNYYLPIEFFSAPQTATLTTPSNTTFNTSS